MSGVEGTVRLIYKHSSTQVRAMMPLGDMPRDLHHRNFARFRLLASVPTYQPGVNEEPTAGPQRLFRVD